MNTRILSMNERGWRTGGRAAVVSNQYIYIYIYFKNKCMHDQSY